MMDTAQMAQQYCHHHSDRDWLNLLIDSFERASAEEAEHRLCDSALVCAAQAHLARPLPQEADREGCRRLVNCS
ncbi:hypothetical protein [Rhodopseudomonas palustris]|uniref:hypothetical protein n=2 Tax=Rhodopseudomonas TaxID=1073 RepID=UPI000A7A2BC1|nr:hypothetical protein [Rhodopseudomonas palustris]